MKDLDMQAAKLISGGCGIKERKPWEKPDPNEKPTPCSLDLHHMLRPKPHSFFMVVYGSLED